MPAGCLNGAFDTGTEPWCAGPVPAETIGAVAT